MSKINAKILFFVPEWPVSTSGVLHSQVLSVARYLSSLGYACLFVGADTSSDKEISVSDVIRRDYGIDAFISEIENHNRGFFGIRRNAVNVAVEAHSIICEFAPTHIYARSVAVSSVAFKIAKEIGAISVLDIRAALSEEVKERAGGGVRYLLIRALERYEIKKSDRLSCVSRNLKKYLEENIKNRKISVIPSCVDPDKFKFDMSIRDEIRLSFGVNGEETLFCYSGGLAEWQRVIDICMLFTRLSELSNSYKFLFVTRDVDEIVIIAKKNGLDVSRYRVVSAAQDEVHKYLCASDVGVIMRHSNILNNVASPIKLGEYLLCGLPVVLTNGIGDYSDEIVECGCGVMVNGGGATDAEKVINFLKGKHKSALRDTAIRFAHSKFLLSSYKNEYLELYE